MATNIRDALVPEIQKLRSESKTWTEIGRALGITGTTSHMAVDPEYAAKRRARINMARISRSSSAIGRTGVIAPTRMTAAQVRNIVANIPPDTRTPIQKMFGDPPKGRSALDQKNGVQI